MGYVSRSLANGEKVIGYAKIHWSVWIWAIIKYTILLAAWAAMYLKKAAIVTYFADNTEIQGDLSGYTEYVGYFAMFALAVTSLRFAWFLTLLRSTEYAVTTRRLVAKHGILARATVEMQLRKIESLYIKQGLLGRIFASGRVIATGTGGTVRPWRTISRPLRFKQQIEHAIEMVEKS